MDVERLVKLIGASVCLKRDWGMARGRGRCVWGGGGHYSVLLVLGVQLLWGQGGAVGVSLRGWAFRGGG